MCTPYHFLFIIVLKITIEYLDLSDRYLEGQHAISTAQPTEPYFYYNQGSHKPISRVKIKHNFLVLWHGWNIAPILASKTPECRSSSWWRSSRKRPAATTQSTTRAFQQNGTADRSTSLTLEQGAQIPSGLNPICMLLYLRKTHQLLTHYNTNHSRSPKAHFQARELTPVSSGFWLVRGAGSLVSWSSDRNAHARLPICWKLPCGGELDFAGWGE